MSKNLKSIRRCDQKTDSTTTFTLFNNDPLVMNDNDKAIKLLESNPAMGRKSLSAALGISENQARKLIKQVRGTSGKKSTKLVATSNKNTSAMQFKKAVPAEDFRKQFDVPLKIRMALKGLEAAVDPNTGKKTEDSVISDNDFRVELGIQSQQWASARQMEEFSKFQIVIRGKMYWAPPRAIEKIRNTIDIS